MEKIKDYKNNIMENKKIILKIYIYIKYIRNKVILKK